MRFAEITFLDRACGAASVAALAVAVVAFFIANVFAVAANRLTFLSRRAANVAAFDFARRGATVTVDFVAIVAFFKTVGIELAIAESGRNAPALIAWIIGAFGARAGETANAFVIAVVSAVGASVAGLVAFFGTVDRTVAAFDGDQFFTCAVLGIADKTIFGLAVLCAVGLSFGRHGGITLFVSGAKDAIAAARRSLAFTGTAVGTVICSTVILTFVTFLAIFRLWFTVTAIGSQRAIAGTATLSRFVQSVFQRII